MSAVLPVCKSLTVGGTLLSTMLCGNVGACTPHQALAASEMPSPKRPLCGPLTRGELDGKCTAE